jgi:hypothetical protein
VHVAVLGKDHSFLALDHLIVLVEGDELAVVALRVLHDLHLPEGPQALG